MILIIGGLDAQCAETVDAAANELGDDVAAKAHVSEIDPFLAARMQTCIIK